jgi:hypothetical protein
MNASLSSLQIHCDQIIDPASLGKPYLAIPKKKKKKKKEKNLQMMERHIQCLSQDFCPLHSQNNRSRFSAALHHYKP